MTDDLVTRLRNHIAITTKLHYSPKDGYPEPVMVHGPSPICQEAADEIERLRQGGCARDQRTTQFCAEAVELQREIERLRKERDEARREVCNNEANRFPTMADPHREANRRGWDCFKENNNDR